MISSVQVAGRGRKVFVRWGHGGVVLCDHVFQQRKTSTFLHDSGVFFSEMGQSMSRGWGSSVISVVSLPVLVSSVV